MYPELTQFINWLKCQYPNSSTSVHYSSDLALFFSFSRKPPAIVTSIDVDGYISYSLGQGNKPATVNRRLSALRTFYYFLSMACELPLACPVLPRHRLRKSYPLPRDVDDANIQHLFRVISCSRDRAMFLLMLDCGLRVGEVHSLSLDDVRLENSPQILVHGKGGRQRIVYLSQRAQDALQLWLNSRPVSKDRAVFISGHSKRLSIAGIQYLLRLYCERIGVRFSCHQLRHTFGRRMAEADLPLTSLQALLGHKSVRTTQLYVHLSNRYLQAEYDQAMSQKTVPGAVDNQVQCKKQTHFPSQKSVNWNGYLSGLPNWLSDLIRGFCTSHRQVYDPIQQTRNRLCQLSQFFRWVKNEYKLFGLGDVTPRLWFVDAQMRQGSGIQPTSLNTALRALRAFLRFAKDSGYSSCERILDVRPLRTGEVLPRDISETQLSLLLKQANRLDQAWILLMAHSGLRTCEIRALRWRDVDLQKRTLRIEESKGLQGRVVFLSTPTTKILKRLPKASGPIFTHHNLPFSNRYCQSRLKTIGKKCGMHVTPHQLRHTCATMLLNVGMSIFSVQVILGHKYVDTTLRYARIYDSIVAKNYKHAIETVQQKKSARSLPY